MNVLISGAGIAGPTLALFLAKTGARITIVEKSASLQPHGQSVDITGSARAVIKKMGIMDEVRRFHTTEAGTQFVDAQGRPFARFPVNKGSSATMTSEFEILRGDLALVLYEATRRHPNIEYKFSTTVQRIISNDADAVSVELSTGETLAFDLLVAADGQWSKIRKHAFPPSSVQAVDKNMYAVYFTIPRAPSDTPWWTIHVARSSRILALRPDPHNTTRALLTKMPLDDSERRAWTSASRGDRATQEDLVRSEFRDAGWLAKRLLDDMSSAPDFYFHPIQQIRMATWSANRIVCLGDAGYAPSPLTGMGTSLAIDGAYVLAGELSKLGAAEHPSRALQAYEAAFRPFVDEIHKVPSWVPGVLHPGTVWARWACCALIWVLARLAALPWLVDRFDMGKELDLEFGEYPVLE